MKQKFKRLMRQSAYLSIASLLSFLAVCYLPAEAVAKDETFPGRDIVLVVPHGAGGGYDTYARGIAPFVQKHLPRKVNVIIKNIPGAGGKIGTTQVYRSKPDGYTVQIVNAVALSTSQLIYGARFDLTRMTWIGRVSTTYQCLMVRFDSDIKSWDDFISKIKSGKLLMATAGVGSAAHTNAALVSALEGIPIDMVHYEGTNGAMAGLARKEADAIILAIGTALKAQEQGVGKPIVLFAPERYKPAPEIPTSIEFKIAKAETYNDLFTNSRSWAGPPGIPAERLGILSGAFYNAANDPKFIEWTRKVDLEVDPLPAAETKAAMLKYVETQKKVVPILKQALLKKKK